MIRQYVHGNVLEAFSENKFDGIVQGCNCFHLMGAGFAAQIAKEYPVAVEADNKTEHGDWSKLGTYSVADTVNGVIINGYTQFRPGRSPADVLYANIRELFTDLNKQYAGKVFGIPKIGAGIAGGDWETIAEIIQEVTPNLGIDVYYV